MRKESWTVKGSDMRPARHDGTCFYCRVPMGGEHEKGCVIRQRTVTVEMTIRFPISVPEDWDEEAINFHRNESTWCASNVIPELEREAKRQNGCLCQDVDFRYLGESIVAVEKMLHDPQE